MKHRQITRARLAVQARVVENLHHRLQGWVQLGKAVAEIDGLVLRYIKRGSRVCVVGRIAGGNDCVDAVVSAVLENENQFSVGQDVSGQQAPLEQPRRKKINAKSAPGH